jgi:transcriptional regulator with XRE-family HTH domain
LKNLTQAELAEKADVSTALIAEIETKKRNPTLTTIGKIACGLNIQPQLLFVDKKTIVATEKPDTEELRIRLHDAIDDVLGSNKL